MPTPPRSSLMERTLSRRPLPGAAAASERLYDGSDEAAHRDLRRDAGTDRRARLGGRDRQPRRPHRTRLRRALGPVRPRGRGPERRGRHRLEPRPPGARPLERGQGGDRGLRGCDRRPPSRGLDGAGRASRPSGRADRALDGGPDRHRLRAGARRRARRAGALGTADRPSQVRGAAAAAPGAPRRRPRSRHAVARPCGGRGVRRRPARVPRPLQAADAGGHSCRARGRRRRPRVRRPAHAVPARGRRRAGPARRHACGRRTPARVGLHRARVRGRPARGLQRDHPAGDPGRGLRLRGQGRRGKLKPPATLTADDVGMGGWARRGPAQSSRRAEAVAIAILVLLAGLLAAALSWAVLGLAFLDALTGPAVSRDAQQALLVIALLVGLLSGALANVTIGLAAAMLGRPRSRTGRAAAGAAMYRPQPAPGGPSFAGRAFLALVLTVCFYLIAGTLAVLLLTVSIVGLVHGTVDRFNLYAL